jgi:hypothetical protein
MPARRKKTDYASQGFQHREHRSKRGRQNKRKYKERSEFRVTMELKEQDKMAYEARKAIREFNYEKRNIQRN